MQQTDKGTGRVTADNENNIGPILAFYVTCYTLISES